MSTFRLWWFLGAILAWFASSLCWTPNFSTNPSKQPTPPTACGDSEKCSAYRGVYDQAFAAAISGIEGGYSSAGKYVCDKRGNCGRGLGRYQFMSYRRDTRAFISAHPGGSKFLEKVDSGAPITNQEVLRYFPPYEQDALFKKDSHSLLDRAAGQIDPTTGKPFTGIRLVERGAQQHYGGLGAPIDGPQRDAHGRLTIYSYGKTAAGNYQRIARKLHCY